jgi:uncharacterized membrane protein YphA (DoxX/SURF4 family)
MNNSLSRSFLSNEWLVLATRLIMGAIFLYAAWDKFLHPREFAITIAAYKILPWQLINISAILLPSLELVIGVALIVGFFPRGSAFIMTVLMLIFMLAFTIAMLKGVNLADCGCFSNTHDIETSSKGSSYTWIYLLRDLGFLLLLVHQLIFGNRQVLALQNIFRKKSGQAAISQA